MSKIDIIIVHFGDISTTEKAISSLERYVSYNNIIIVNNDINVNTVDYFSKHKKVIAINTGENIGFARGVNVGIKRAIENGAKYIVLFNNDASAESDFTTQLLKIFQDNKKAGILSPVVRFKREGKTKYDIGGNVQKYTGKTYHTNVERISKSSLIPVTYVSGCCMMVRTEILEDVGKFDEQFFLYYEDVDFCLRAQSSGCEIFITTDSVINHELSKTVGKSSNTALYHLIRSGRRFGYKYNNMFPLHTIFMLYQSFVFFIRSPFSLASIIKGWL